MNNKDGTPFPAVIGSLSANVFADMKKIHHFKERQSELMTGLYLIRVPPDALRDEVARLMMLEFGYGRTQPVAHYVKRLGHYGSKNSVRAAIVVLERLGVAHVQRHPNDARAFQVFPTVRAVEFYNTRMPLLSAEADKIFGR